MKTLADFPKNRWQPMGIASACKSCANAKKRATRAANPEKAHAEYRKQYDTHRDAWLARSKKWHARRKGATISPVDYARILVRDGMVCYLCHKAVAPKQLSYDHVVPLSRGGTHSEDNLKVTHRSCNSRKNAMPLEQYLRRIAA